MQITFFVVHGTHGCKNPEDLNMYQLLWSMFKMDADEESDNIAAKSHLHCGGTVYKHMWGDSARW